jgi:DNA polymerase III subunit delta'
MTTVDEIRDFSPTNWDELLGHQSQRQWIHNALVQGRLATSFLFVGREGIGKRTFARLLAKSLLCRSNPIDALNPCGSCEDCVQLDASTHPDLIEIRKPEDKAEIPLKLIIGDVDHRMREGLCYEISLSPYGGRKKVAIIDDADLLNEEGANALLKTLEEPPPDSLIILIGSNYLRQLPTIRSRCQKIIFHPLSAPEIQQLILRQSLVDDPAQAIEIAAASGGSISEAIRMCDPELREFRSGLCRQLTSSRIDLLEVAKSCGQVVEAAGKEARLKRDRLKLILQVAADHYRSLIMRLIAADSPAEQTAKVQAGVRSASGSQSLPEWNEGLQAAVDCWQACLNAIDQVDRNVNQTALLQAWVAEIAHHSRR